MTTTKKDLEYFGDGLQYRFVKSLIETPSTFVEVENYLNPDQFNDTGLVDILTVMKSFYKEKGHTPTYVDLEYRLKTDIKDVQELKLAYTAFKRLRSDELKDGMDTASEVGLEYVKRLEAIRQLDNAKRSISTSGYEDDRLTRIVDGLQNILGTTTASYSTPGDLWDNIMDESNEEKVPTGIEILDRQMNGGLARTTTGLLIAGTGVGKTTLFSIMACEAAKLGYKVLYVYFEDKDTDFCRKFYSHITGRYTDDFHKDSSKCKEAEEEVKAIFKDNPDVKKAFYENVRAMRLPNGETTVDMLKAKIRSMIAGGWKPDVVFLDYIGCMKSSTDSKMSVEKEYATLDRCMKRLDSFAQEENFALWVAQQTNRDGSKSESSDRMGNIQGSFRLTQTASAILYLERNNDDSDDFNRINLYLDKCRGASLGAWKNAYLNNGTCQIDLANTEPDDPFVERERPPF